MILVIFLIKRPTTKVRGWTSPKHEHIVNFYFKSKGQVGLHQKLSLEGRKGGGWKCLKSVPRGCTAKGLWAPGQASCSHHQQPPGTGGAHGQQLLCLGPQIPQGSKSPGDVLSSSHHCWYWSLRLPVAIQTSLGFRSIFDSMESNWSPVWERIPSLTGIRKAAHHLQDRQVRLLQEI